MSTATAKVIVLTGATRGLGRALVPKFVAAGHTVIGCGTSAAAVMQLQQEFGEPHDFEAIDVRDSVAVAAWAERILGKYGPPDLLINNAAVMNNPTPLWHISDAEFDKLIDVNIKGVANVLRGFVGAMVNQNRGVIVNLSSGWGRSTAPKVAPYCATKYAIEGLTLALAQELPNNMAAVPLNPGIINTDMLRQCLGGAAASYVSPEKWAEKAAPFLLRLSAKDNGKSLTVS